MADPELRADLEATLAARRELGDEYDAALARSFLEKLDREVDARVQQALTARDAGRSVSVLRGRRRGTSSFALASIALGIPVSAVVASNLHGNTDSLIGVVVAWAAIAAINVVHTFDRRR
ncbi:MAG TPA: hypothetical protein VND62_07205 [Acidimicrobiales bacterium]|nr:hypothetical protein [Acidimicrobiales bacterium]